MHAVANGAAGVTQRAILLGTLFCVASCGGSSPSAPFSPSPTGGVLHAEVTDAAGDAMDSQVNPPDLVHATVDVAAGSITFHIRLAPGTFNSHGTRLYIAFDTDENPSTGNAVWGIGMDFDAWIYAIDRVAVIRRRFPDNSAADVGTVAATVAADGMDVTIPLTLLGNDEGRLDFEVHSSGDPRVAGQSAAILDMMPNLGLAPVRIR